MEKTIKVFRNNSSSRGGYVNHPDDPGGETNLGVTKRVYEEWCMSQDFIVKDMKDLEVSDVAPIYKKNYWDRVKGDELPSGLICVFLILGLTLGPDELLNTFKVWLALLLMGQLAQLLYEQSMPMCRLRDLNTLSESTNTNVKDTTKD